MATGYGFSPLLFTARRSSADIRRTLEAGVISMTFFPVAADFSSSLWESWAEFRPHLWN